jgi:general L-amino acid transport system permease protein
MVTLVVAGVGIVASLPLGILLALGRRSRLPVVKFFSVLFIEFVRGVPLITVLFMANVMLPLFVPQEWSPDRLLRPLLGVALFASAYMAEVVRGGLQAIPKGQYEGAMSLGLGYGKMMRFIVLPQALRIVIPGIVNTFIGLFKDTTLVTIIGLFDFMKTIEASFADPSWATPTTRSTGYAFAAIFYFLCCWGMSRYSISVEQKLAAGQKR